MFANKVLMVRPTDFAFNSQTGLDNEFQQHLDLPADEIRQRALAEFSQAVASLKAVGVDVLVLEKEPDGPQTPDAIFPNNWFATDAQGTLYLFPMKTENRQWEVRPVAVKQLLQQKGLSVASTVAVEQCKDGMPLILEGTGAIVFDHQQKLAYAALSERCHESLLTLFCQQIGYQSFSFATRSSNDKAIYHTNVLMSVGKDFVVACVEGIAELDRQRFITRVEASGKTLIDISMAQMEQHFCGNILELESSTGDRILALSQKAWEGFVEGQQVFFSERMTICANDITTIETIGGGSMRCMLAEVFNPLEG
jgi:hypothetical protein